MRRGSLFFTGLVSAIVTIISLNVVFGNRYGRYPFYREHYGCYERHGHPFRDKEHRGEKGAVADSSVSNY